MRLRVKKGAVLVLAGLFCLSLFRPAFSQEMTAEQLTAGMRQKWSSVKDFQTDLTIGMQMFGKMMKIEGTVWQKERLFRAEMTLPPELMPAGNKPGEPIKALMVFDGKTMWQSLPMMNLVTRTDFSALEGKLKNTPFSKPSYVLPELSFQLSEKNRDGNDYYFLETGDVEDFIQNSPVSSVGVNLPANMSFQSVGIWVNKTSLFPELIEFYAQDHTPGMFLQFKNIKTEQGLASELFTFRVPKDAMVMDMTEAVKALAGKKAQQPSAPDTGQAPE